MTNNEMWIAMLGFETLAGLGACDTTELNCDAVWQQTRTLSRDEAAEEYAAIGGRTVATTFTTDGGVELAARVDVVEVTSLEEYGWSGCDFDLRRDGVLADAAVTVRTVGERLRLTLPAVVTVPDEEDASVRLVEGTYPVGKEDLRVPVELPDDIRITDVVVLSVVQRPDACVSAEACDAVGTVAISTLVLTAPNTFGDGGC